MKKMVAIMVGMAVSPLAGAQVSLAPVQPAQPSNSVEQARQAAGNLPPRANTNPVEIERILNDPRYRGDGGAVVTGTVPSQKQVRVTVTEGALAAKAAVTPRNGVVTNVALASPQQKVDVTLAVGYGTLIRFTDASGALLPMIVTPTPNSSALHVTPIMFNAGQAANGAASEKSVAAAHVVPNAVSWAPTNLLLLTEDGTPINVNVTVKSEADTGKNFSGVVNIRLAWVAGETTAAPEFSVSNAMMSALHGMGPQGWRTLSPTHPGVRAWQSPEGKVLVRLPAGMTPMSPPDNGNRARDGGILVQEFNRRPDALMVAANGAPMTVLLK